MPAQLYNNLTDVNSQFDAIVVGSGIGGLSVASLLAKEGKKVLVLERHYEIGGYTHTFQRKGFTWDVGLHYVGQVHIAGTALNKVFRYISDEQLTWAPLDENYDRAVFGTERFNFVRGRDNLKNALKIFFPDAKDHVSIDAYFQLLADVDAVGVSYYIEKVLPPLLSKLFGSLLRKKVLAFSDRTTLDVLRSITENKKLIGVLTSQYGDYGLPPSKSSFYMHALLANHYMEGAGYPVGGAKKIAQTIIPVIEKAGGAVVFLADVKHVIVDKNRAVGVEMMDGKKFYGTSIISDTGVVHSFSSLLPPDTRQRHHLDEQLTQLEPSAAHVGLYLGIKGSAKELKLPACNYWLFPAEYDHELNQSRYTNFDSTLPVSYISFPAAKDPEWQRTHPDTSTVEVIVIVPYDWFSSWENTTRKKRGDEYEKRKQQLGEQLLQELYRVEPQLQGRIEYMEVSTPLTTKTFTNHQHGEIYGVAHTPSRFRQRFLKPVTPVKNFYLTGQDAFIASIAGGLMGGILCASAILKKDILSKIKRTIS